jgi:CheY-like chemotaxis protein
VVLAIDDDPDVIYLLQENLAEAGYRVVGATSGVEGLRQAREIHPLAITLDILMPHRDGWQVLHELKSDPQTRAIPVVLVSIVDNQALGFRLGAADRGGEPQVIGQRVSGRERLQPLGAAVEQGGDIGQADEGRLCGGPDFGGFGDDPLRRHFWPLAASSRSHLRWCFQAQPPVTMPLVIALTVPFTQMAA